MFKRQTSDIQFIAVTLVLVLLLGARTFSSLMEEEALPEATVTKMTTATADSTRAPASVPSSINPKVGSALEQFTQFDLSCTKKPAQTISVRGGFVQFQGKNCAQGLEVNEVEIVNKSNGYTASVFSRGANKYQTDLIQLQSGENEIAIRYREHSGKAVEEVIHVRSTKI